MDPKIYVSTPAHHNTEIAFDTSINQMFSTSKKARELGVRRNVSYGDSLIERVRNIHLTDFMRNKDCEYFISLDTDIAIENITADDNLLDRLITMADEHEFVGGIYPLKTGATSSPWASVPADEGELRKGLNPPRVIEMRWLSTGCWCLKRSVVDRYAQAYPELWYDGDGPNSGQKLYGAYLIELVWLKEQGRMVKKMLSEDWMFCHRWQQIGGRLWADTGIRLGHVGKFVYHAHGYQPMEAKNGTASTDRNHADHRTQGGAEKTDGLVARAVGAYRACAPLGRLPKS